MGLLGVRFRMLRWDLLILDFEGGDRGLESCDGDRLGEMWEFFLLILITPQL